MDRCVVHVRGQYPKNYQNLWGLLIACPAEVNTKGGVRLPSGYFKIFILSPAVGGTEGQ